MKVLFLDIDGVLVPFKEPGKESGVEAYYFLISAKRAL